MAAAAQSRTNWFAVGISITVAVVLIGLGALVVILNNQAAAPGAAPESSIIDDESGAITFGSGPDTVDTFVDFICPACADFEKAYGEALQSAAAEDQITLNLHPVSILDHYSTPGSEYSSRAAGAMYCVAAEAPDSALDYFNLLFANQPAERTAGLSDAELTEFATQAGAGAAKSCIADGTYTKFAREQALHHEIQGTPTVEVNGERIDNTDISARLGQLLG